MSPASKHYDLIVLGSGPGGQRAAVQAAKLGKRVLIVEKNRVGGACLHSGTIPSKALREAALASMPGASSVKNVMARTHWVIEEECGIISDQLARNNIELATGIGSFVDEKQIEIVSLEGASRVTGEFIVIAVGTRPRRPAEVVFDGQIMYDSDTILSLPQEPRSLLVLGAGVIGCEYASIFARAGVKVTLVETKPALLTSIDPEIVQALLRQFDKSGIKVLTDTQYGNVRRAIDRQGRAVAQVDLVDPERKWSDTYDAVLYCLGRSGNCEGLNLKAVGLEADDRGNLKVNKNYQTRVPHIYAVGDIIGAPALAASSSEQGRLAALHAFTGQAAEFPDTFPYGIYTIPEISSVGYQESQLAKRKIKYVVGKAQYSELARGKMIDDEHGFLKLIVHAKTHRVVGVHVIGTSATELVHIGQVAIAFGANVEFFVENVFNYPTLAEAYKVAAFNAINQLRQGA